MVFADKIMEPRTWKKIHLFDTTFRRMCRWIDTVSLKLAEQETEALLITSRKVAETVPSQIGDFDQNLTSGFGSYE